MRHLYRPATAPAWLARDEVLETFPDLQAFEQFVAEGNEDALEAFYARRRWSPILGDDAFATFALAAAQRSREHPRAQQTPQFPTLDSVVRAVCQRTDSAPEAMATSWRGRANLPRSLAVFVASRVAGFSHPAIKQCFAIHSNSAVTRICDRTRARIAKTPYLQGLLQALELR